MAENEGPRMDEFIGRTDMLDPALPQAQFDTFTDNLAKDQVNSVRVEQLVRLVKAMRAAVVQWSTAFEAEGVDVDLGDDNG